MDKYYMGLAKELAKKGIGKVNPNPLVGAVIVKNQEIIGKGYHMAYGKAHAEINAFNNATNDVKGATMYITLEPCSHYGKTPPCVDQIIQKGIKRVVVGSLDPNPLVAGNGIKRLKEAEIEVEVGVLESECNKVNEVFMKYIVTKRPFVVMKCAMSLDGKISTSSGESKWITGEASRRYVHETRNKLSGIMVGVETVIKDNPELTCRIDNGRNPVRIIVDSTLRIPLESKVIKETYKAKTIIATTKKASEDKIKTLEDKGVSILIIKLKNERVDLNDLMTKLGELEIDSILLEGGATLNFSALDEGIVDKVEIYIAPMIIGGEVSKTPVGGRGVEFLKEAYKLKDLSSKCIGDDILLEGYIE